MLSVRLKSGPSTVWVRLLAGSDKSPFSALPYQQSIADQFAIGTMNDQAADPQLVAPD